MMSGNTVAPRPVVGSGARDAEHARNRVSPAQSLDDVLSRRHSRARYDDQSIGASKTNNGGEVDPPPERGRKEELDAFAKGVGRRLKLLREEFGLNTQKMADALHVSRARYSHWENGRHLPNDELAVIRICELTGATLDYIYRGKLETLKGPLAIRLRGREEGLIPPP
jgi:DNA-binding XRE family transcriptional regulator